MSPLAFGFCLPESQRPPTIKCTSTNDNSTARPFYFSKLGWAPDHCPRGRQRFHSSPKIFLFSFLSYKANIKNVIWIWEKLNLKGTTAHQSGVLNATHCRAWTHFYKHRLSLFSSARWPDSKLNPGAATGRLRTEDQTAQEVNWSPSRDSSALFFNGSTHKILDFWTAMGKKILLVALFLIIPVL